MKNFIEDISTIILTFLILGPALLAAFVVALPMGLAMLLVIFLAFLVPFFAKR